MPEDTEPTIESLQKQILDLSAKMQTQSAEFEQLKKDKEAVDNELKSAHEVNTKLWLSANSAQTVKGIDNESDEGHEETREEFIDSFIKPNLERMREKIGDKTLGAEMFDDKN